MKTSFYILIAATLVLGSCSGSYRAGVSTYDDLYYTPRTTPVQTEVVEVESGTTLPPATEELSDYERYRMEMENEALQAGETTYAT